MTTAPPRLMAANANITPKTALNVDMLSVQSMLPQSVSTDAPTHNPTAMMPMPVRMREVATAPLMSPWMNITIIMGANRAVRVRSAGPWGWGACLALSHDWRWATTNSAMAA